MHLDITEGCNLRCIHCRNNLTNKTPSKELSAEQIKDILKTSKERFKNFEQLFIGGGEPLTKKQKVFEIIDYCSKLGLKCSLNTNATLITEEDLPHLKKLSAIQVSLDGACPQTHDHIRSVPGTFDKAVKNIKLLVRNGIYVCVRMTLFELNYDEVFDLLDLCRKWGVSSFSWFRVLPAGRAEYIKGTYVDPKIYYLIMKEMNRQKYISKDIKIVSSEPCKIALDEPLRKKILNKSGKNSVSGCLPGYIELFISANGDVYPCTMLQNYKLGNILEDNIEDIWLNSPPLDSLRNKNNLKGKCGNCKHKNLCGGCRASALGIKGDLFQEDPYCPLQFSSKEVLNINKTKSPCQAH